MLDDLIEDVTSRFLIRSYHHRNLSLLEFMVLQETFRKSWKNVSDLFIML